MTRIPLPALAIALLSALAAPALAGDRSDARAAIDQADRAIQMAWASGAADRAAVPQAQAVAAQERARHQLSKSHEHHAYYAAREAEAYARLALATAQSRSGASNR